MIIVWNSEQFAFKVQSYEVVPLFSQGAFSNRRAKQKILKLISKSVFKDLGQIDHMSDTKTTEQPGSMRQLSGCINRLRMLY